MLKLLEGLAYIPRRQSSQKLKKKDIFLFGLLLPRIGHSCRIRRTAVKQSRFESWYELSTQVTSLNLPAYASGNLRTFQIIPRFLRDPLLVRFCTLFTAQDWILSWLDALLCKSLDNYQLMDWPSIKSLSTGPNESSERIFPTVDRKQSIIKAVRHITVLLMRFRALNIIRFVHLWMLFYFF